MARVSDYLLDRSKSAPSYSQSDSFPVMTDRARSFTYHFYPPIDLNQGVVQADVENGNDNEDHANSASVFLTIFITFLSNVVFSIVLPSLPIYLMELHASDYYNGWAVAVNSLGSFLSSPLFGYWADKRTFREVFLSALVIMLLSNIWYALAGDMYQLFMARFLVGVAGGSFAPASSYLAYATLPHERAKVMTWNAASSVLGCICGPSFALLTALPALTFTAYIGTYKFVFNSQTAPGWISALFAVLGMFCLIWFKEVKRKPSPNLPISTIKSKLENDPMGQSSIRSIQSYSMIAKTKVPVLGVIVCLFYTFSFTTTFTIFETIGPLYLTKFYHFNVYYTSLLFLAISGIALFALASLYGFLYFFKDERILMIFFGTMLTGGLITVFSWDSDHVSLLRFCVGIGIVSYGYADAAALLLSLFSQLLEEREQGVMMGWLSSTGCIARMLCPLGAAYVYNAIGANYIFLASAALCFISNMGIVFAWENLKKPAPKVSIVYE